MPHIAQTKNTSSYHKLSSAEVMSATKKVDKGIHSERTSSLAKELSEEFRGANQIFLKSQGAKMEGLERKQKAKQKHRSKIKAGPELSNEPAGGPSTRQHPALPISEGIAPDDVLIPDSDLSPEEKHDLTESEKLENKTTRKARAEKKRKHKHKMAMKQKQKPAPKQKQTYSYQPERKRPPPRPSGPGGF